MKKSLLILFAVVSSIATNAQICTMGINSVVFAPVANSTDLELTINSSCCEIHHFEGYTLINDPSGQIINLCYVDTGLTMPSTLATTITLPGLNIGTSQTFTINALFNWGAPGQACIGGQVFSPSTTLTLQTPITQPRTFQLATEEHSLKKTTLFPNPNSGNFALELPFTDQQAQLIVTDLSGKKVFSTLSYFSGNTIELKGLASGLYFVKVTQNESAETLKFVVN